MAETNQKRPRRKRVPASNGDAPVLDLRTLAEPRQRVLTTPGEFQLRRIAELSAVDRTIVTDALAACQRMSALVEDADPEQMQSLIDQLEEHENRILEQALVGVSREQLSQMPPPQRAGVVAAFFGATAAQALNAAAQIRAMRGPSTGARSRRASSASTGATRKAG